MSNSIARFLSTVLIVSPLMHSEAMAVFGGNRQAPPPPTQTQTPTPLPGGGSGGMGNSPTNGGSAGREISVSELMERVITDTAEADPERTETIRYAQEALLDRNRSGVLLVGESGSGKSYVAEFVASAMEAEGTPARLRDRPVYRLNTDQLFAKGEEVGYYARLLEMVISEINKTSPKGILLVEPMDSLIRDQNRALFDHLRSAMANNRLTCICTASDAFFRAQMNRDSAFLAKVSTLTMPSLEAQQITSILRSHKRALQQDHGITITDAALSELPELARRYYRTEQIVGSPRRELELLNEILKSMKSGADPVREARTALARLSRQMESLTADLESLGADTDAGRLVARELEALRTEESDLNTRVQDLQRTAAQSTPFSEQITQKETQRTQLENMMNRPEVRGNERQVQELDNRIKTLNAEIQELYQRVANSNSRSFILDVTTLRLHLSKITGVPAGLMGQSQNERIRNLDAGLREVVVGQEQGLRRVSAGIKIRASGQDSPDGKGKPIGSILLLGPSGVGKTETAKQVSRILFGHDNIIRMDMGDFNSEHDVSRLRGAPPGYVGFDSEGTLTDMVRQNPFSVVLIDEFEKAHNKIRDFFLSINDEGFARDGQGRMVDFSNVVLIYTSNAGSEIYDTQPGTPEREEVLKRLRSYDASRVQNPTPDALNREALFSYLIDVNGFRKEGLGRFSSIAVYNHLGDDQIRAIIAKDLRQNARNLLVNRDITLQFTNELVEYLRSNTQDSRFGGRAHRPLYEEMVRANLAELLLGGVERGDVITVDIDPERNDLSIHRATQAEALRLAMQGLDVGSIHADIQPGGRGAERLGHQAAQRERIRALSDRGIVERSRIPGRRVR